MASLVIGGTGTVGAILVQLLRQSGATTYSISRRGGSTDDDITYDIRTDSRSFPPASTVFATAEVTTLAPLVPRLASGGCTRLVALSSTSGASKLNSPLAAERELARNFLRAEQALTDACGMYAIEWTILRPTVIYCEGRDLNISRIADIIRKYRAFPLYGAGQGRRQPVHAEDLANGMIRAASSKSAVNATFDTPGGETLAYAEMVGRIFDALGRKRRLIHVPPLLWRVAFAMARPLFPGTNVAMGLRMASDLEYDIAPAAEAFGWAPRPFKPTFL